MQLESLRSPRGPRLARLSPLAALALLAAIGFGCASAPPPAAPVPLPTDLPFAFRDPRDGAPEPRPAPRDEKVLAAALWALRRGDAGAAGRTLSGRGRGADAPPALRLAAAYVALSEKRLDEAREALAALTADHSGWPAAVEARADLAALEGRVAEAFELYQRLRAILPADRRTLARVETLRGEVAAARRREAETALLSGDLDGARKAANGLLQLEPASPSGPVLLSRAASAAGRPEDAWTWAQEARKRAPSDASVAAFAAGVAARAGRWASAADLYEELAAADPSFVPKAEEARLEFKIQNLPDEARRAALSPRVTRAQLSSLLWWTIPEVRDASVPPGVGIAVDVVDRPDRVALVRAIGLGFFGVSPETHQVGAEVPLARREMGVLLRRVAFLSGRGRAPVGCLAAEAPLPASLAECGILHDTQSRDVTGREALRALEKAARLGREGGTR